LECADASVKAANTGTNKLFRDFTDSS